jgi:hypothetical protein
VDAITWTFDDVLLCADERVIEVFRLLVVGSQRTPLVWAGARLTPKKQDRIEVTVGQSSTAGSPFYNDTVVCGGAYVFQIPSTEEPGLRSFLDQVAQRAAPSTTG